MQWVDEAIVLGVKRHGEASAVLEVMTREHGRHLGLVRGAASTRLGPVLQPGNRVSVTWRARLEIAAAIEQPVHLFLFVKVREGWGDDPERYRQIGLEFPRE